MKQIQYNRIESRLSDHRPVYGMFVAYVEVSKTPGVHSSTLSSRTVDSEPNLHEENMND